MISLIGEPQWFAAADAAGDVERLLDDPEWGAVVAGLVGRLAIDLPDRTLELLRPRQLQGEPWVNALRLGVEVSDSSTWAAFAIEQLESGGLDLPNEPFDILETPLFHRMVESHPIDALRLLTVTLTRDVDRAIAEQADSLQDVLSRRGNHSVDAGQIEQLASSVGPQFVETMLPLIETIATYSPPGGRQMWRFRLGRTHRDFDEDLFFTFEAALTQLTRDVPDRASPLLERLTNHHVDALNFLVCRALHEAPADCAVDWILEADEHRAIGWISNFRWETRRLIEHASHDCSDDRFAALESIILYWNPEYASPASKLQWRGLAELELLRALAVHRLSPIANRRLAELSRKFPSWEPIEPEGMSGGFVQSPISREPAERMTNAHWRRAMDKYAKRDRRTSFRDGSAFGGTDELANMMGTLAKQSPSRFLDFALTFPASMPATYTEHVIRSIAGEVSQLELLPLLRKFRTDHPAESGRAVASAIDEYTGELQDELFEELLLLSEDADPSRELARVKAGSDFYFGGDFVTAGINSTRGLVASVLARVIFTDSTRLQASRSVLQRLSEDPIVAVRALTTEPALAYASIARQDGLDLIARLLDDDLVLTTSPALRALRWAMLWDADRFAGFLVRALAGEDAKQAGAVWANCAVNGTLGSAPTEVTALSERARIGAADALAPDPGLAPTLLATFFDDTSPEVRRQAADSVHYLKDVDIDTRSDLIAQLVQSPAFPDASGDLLDALEELPGELPSITWEICRRVVEAVELSPSAGLRALTGNLIAVLVRLYRSSDDAGREAALDLIDQTVLLQLWRVDQLLDDAR